MSAAGFDHVIVGGGSAGCVLAARLSEDPACRVLLLEAGGPDRHPYIHAPAGFAKMTAGPFTWGLRTVPQVHAGGREIPYAQARVLGGGGSINAQVFTRGHPSDYDRWAEETEAPGWSFAELRRFFLRSEGNTARGGDWHGTGGPLAVSDPMEPQPVTRAWVEACGEMGMPLHPDFNGPDQAGAGLYQTTTRNGRRCSAATGYLKPARGRKNLTVETGCLVRRIVIERGRATGVQYARGGEARSARAENAVVLAAGAIGSPKLMMLSGIGPAAHLRERGVNVVLDLPGVGSNLTDHYGIDIVAELDGPHGLDRYNRPHMMAWAAARYALFGTGPATSNIVEGGAFWYSGAVRGVPDLQFHFLAGAGAEAGVETVPSGSGVTLNSYVARPKSRGSVRLRSGDPADAPLVDPNFLAEPEDLAVAVEGVRISRETLRQKALARYIRREFAPGDGIGTEGLADYARAKGRTSYHPVGTCRMGRGEMAVVDPELRVRGIDGLRICDSSIMPSLIGSNTNAATVMIAEKASDLIRGNRIEA